MINSPIKQQGKKTKLLQQIMEVADEILLNHPEIDTWVEPFMGSGVVAFNCPYKIKKVIVNDINPHNINFFKSIYDGTITEELIIEKFTEYSKNLSESGVEYYNKIKDEFNQDHDTMKYLFLTRTGFNGVVRFNSSGHWNVPFCKLNNRLSKNVIDELSNSVEEISELFKRKEFEFHCTSFENVLKDIPANSLIYCDPPYWGLNTQYYKGWKEEQELLLNELLSDKIFIYSTWVNDGHKDNPMIQKCWGQYEIREEKHKYLLAQNAEDRKDIVEGLIYKKNEKIIGMW